LIPWSTAPEGSCEQGFSGAPPHLDVETIENLLLPPEIEACIAARMSDVTGVLEGPRLEALVELLYLAASADGEFSDEERHLFVHKVRVLTGERLTAGDLSNIVTRVEADVARDGRTQRITAVRDRLESSGARHAALLMAIDMTMADDVLRTSEREVIAEIAEGLGIEADVAADYIARMNR
jgi:uncharacterized tellurite resistance protein B-like protein